MTVAAQSCQSQAACTMAPFVTSCDGAEDCPASGSCCVSLQLSESGATSGLAVKGTAACGQTCPVSASSGSYYFDDSVACHTGADCANVVDDSFGVPQNRCCSAAGFAVGECVSDTFKDIFLAGGGTCTN
jgi:hypothetical protein